MKQPFPGIPVILLLIHVSVHLLFGVEASSYIQPAYRYFQAGDYDAAWLFYQRAIINGMDDGREMFRAAESFRQQKIPLSNEILQKRLYSVARYWLQEQYPGSPLIVQAEKYHETGSLVNRSYIRKTYAMVGAPLPDSQTWSTGVLQLYDSLRGSLMNRFRHLGELFRVVRSEGLREAWRWAILPTNQVFSTIIVLYAFAGIILPGVLAFVVARGGRKSYVAAYLFLLFWGPLGVHRFYIGRYISGVLWLLTVGLAGIGVFFDLFLLGEYVHFWNGEYRGGVGSSGVGSSSARARARGRL